MVKKNPWNPVRYIQTMKSNNIWVQSSLQQENIRYDRREVENV